jgi:hypothetical protein
MLQENKNIDYDQHKWWRILRRKADYRKRNTEVGFKANYTVNIFVWN